MKTTIKFLILIITIISFNSCSNKQNGNKSNIKTKRAIRCYYKLGVPDKNGDTTTTNYNEFGMPTEEITSSDKKTYLYEKDTLQVSETHYGLRDNSIWYKKNITYNVVGKKESINIYTSFTVSKTPELVAGMKFFYDVNNKIIAKRYFGGIEYNEEEIPQTVSADSNGPDIFERENKRKADSSSAIYIRNITGKLTQIYFNNDTADKIVFSYNNNGKLISKQRYYSTLGSGSTLLSDLLKNHNRGNTTNENDFTGSRYYYTNNKLSKVEEISNNVITQINIYNEKENILEVKNIFYKQDELSRSWKFTYTDNDNVNDIIKYNKINEPEFIDKFEYEFY